AAGGDCQRPPQPGWHGRAVGEDSHLPFQGKPHQRSSGEFHSLSSDRRPQRRFERNPRRGQHALPIRKTQGSYRRIVTTINTRIAEGRHRLLGAGIERDEAALSARLLAEAVLGWNTTQILTSGDQLEPPAFAAAFEELIARRAHREPLAYITGTREFWNLRFEVSPAVLIPRPETEGLIEAVNTMLPDRAASLRVADVCTGSGCVAVAIAVERRAARVVATDVSAAALEIARRNVMRHGVRDRVECVQGDLLTPLTGRFDLIVANPPYVAVGSRTALQPE